MKKKETKFFARKCDVTGKGMNKGYVQLFGLLAYFTWSDYLFIMQKSRMRKKKLGMYLINNIH